MEIKQAMTNLFFLLLLFLLLCPTDSKRKSGVPALESEEEEEEQIEEEDDDDDDDHQVQVHFGRFYFSPFRLQADLRLPSSFYPFCSGRLLQRRGNPRETRRERPRRER